MLLEGKSSKVFIIKEGGLQKTLKPFLRTLPISFFFYPINLWSEKSFLESHPLTASVPIHVGLNISIKCFICAELSDIVRNYRYGFIFIFFTLQIININVTTSKLRLILDFQHLMP